MLAAVCRGEVGTPEQAEWRLHLGEYAASGTAIAPQLVATARHFTDQLGQAIVLKQLLPGGRMATVHGHTVAVGVGDDDDVSLVQIDDASVVYVPLGTAATQGQTIYACGYGHEGIGRTGGPGIVQGDYNPNSFISTVNIESGDSGGGIFDTSGRLVGVVSGVPKQPGQSQIAQGDVIATKIDSVVQLTQCSGWGGCPGGSCQRPSSSGGSAQMLPWSQLPVAPQVPPGTPAATVPPAQQPAAQPAPTAKEIAAEVMSQLQPAINQKLDAVSSDVKAQITAEAGQIPGSTDLQNAASQAGQAVVDKLTTEIKANPGAVLTGLVAILKPIADAIPGLSLPSWLAVAAGAGSLLLHAFKKNQTTSLTPTAAAPPIIVNVPAPTTPVPTSTLQPAQPATMTGSPAAPLQQTAVVAGPTVYQQVPTVTPDYQALSAALNRWQLQNPNSSVPGVIRQMEGINRAAAGLTAPPSTVAVSPPAIISQADI